MDSHNAIMTRRMSKARSMMALVQQQQQPTPGQHDQDHHHRNNNLHHIFHLTNPLFRQHQSTTELTSSDTTQHSDQVVLDKNTVDNATMNNNNNNNNTDVDSSRHHQVRPTLETQRRRLSEAVLKVSVIKQQQEQEQQQQRQQQQPHSPPPRRLHHHHHHFSPGTSPASTIHNNNKSRRFVVTTRPGLSSSRSEASLDSLKKGDRSNTVHNNKNNNNVTSSKSSDQHRRRASYAHMKELSQRFGGHHQSLSALSYDENDHLHYTITSSSSSSFFDPSTTLHVRSKLEDAWKKDVGDNNNNSQQQQQQQQQHQRRSHQSMSSIDETTMMVMNRIMVDGDKESKSFELEFEPDDEDQQREEQQHEEEGIWMEENLKDGDGHHDDDDDDKKEDSLPPVHQHRPHGRRRSSLMTSSSPIYAATTTTTRYSSSTSLDAPTIPHYRTDTYESLANVSPSEEALMSACNVAYQQYKEDYAHSNIPDRTHKFPQFALSEIVQGRFLGKGSFAQVIEVKGFCLKEHYHRHRHDDDDQPGGPPAPMAHNDTVGPLRMSAIERRLDMVDGMVPPSTSRNYGNNNDDDDNNVKRMTDMAGRRSFPSVLESEREEDNDKSERSVLEEQQQQVTNDSVHNDSGCTEDEEGHDEVSSLMGDNTTRRFGYHDITDDDDVVDDDDDDDNSCIDIAGGVAKIEEDCYDGSMEFASLPPRRAGESRSMWGRRSGTGSADDDDTFISNRAPPSSFSAKVEATTTTHPKRSSSQNSSFHSSRVFIADHCYRSSSLSDVTDPPKKKILAKKGTTSSRPVARYALKQLRPNVVGDPLCLLQGLADMATETRVLSSLADHPHIVKLRGLALADNGSGSPFTRQYFILLDRLYDTLESRMVKWKKEESKYIGIRGFFLDRHQHQRKKLWLDRVTFAYDLSSALAHLHARYVIHRDLKPDNIGFDLRDDIKIFDFGLAKELPTVHNSHESLFHFTSMCGSPRYMAPEVALEKPYNELCDVYSFSMVFWEMMALTKPYGKIDMVGLIEEVWRESDGEDGQQVKVRRPSPSLTEKGKFFSGTGIKGLLRRRRARVNLKKRGESATTTTTTTEHDVHQDVRVGTPGSLQRLLEACWSCNLKKRPSMKQVVEQLALEILAIRDVVNDERRLSHKRRRSTFVFEPELSNALDNGGVVGGNNDRNNADGAERKDGHHHDNLDASDSKSTNRTDPSSTVRTEDQAITVMCE